MMGEILYIKIRINKNWRSLGVKHLIFVNDMTLNSGMTCNMLDIVKEVLSD